MEQGRKPSAPRADWVQGQECHAGPEAHRGRDLTEAVGGDHNRTLRRLLFAVRSGRSNQDQARARFRAMIPEEKSGKIRKRLQPARRLALLARRLVEPHQALERFGDAGVALRRDGLLAPLHPLVVDPRLATLRSVWG